MLAAASAAASISVAANRVAPAGGLLPSVRSGWPFLEPGPNGMSVLPALLASALLAYAAWRDVAGRVIPDGVSLLLAGLGIGLRAEAGIWPLLYSGLSAGALFALLLLCHARGLLGGGDVKLAGAVALGLSPPQCWDFVFITAMVGGVLALAFLALRPVLPVFPPRRRGALLVWRVLAVEAARIRRGGPLPYGVAIALGGALVLLQRGEG
jgi:prepilin peptidase CpaA